jgi:hypothetical protein
MKTQLATASSKAWMRQRYESKSSASFCNHCAAAISYILPLLLNSGAGFPAGRGILNHTATTRFIPGHEQQQQQRGYKSHYRHFEYFTKHITQNI